MLISFGSVPSSGLPAFDITVLTSGIVRIALRMRWFISFASVTDTDGGKGLLIQIEPSFNSGRNSVPSFGSTARLAASAPTATPMTSLRCLSAQCSEGSYSRFRNRTSAFSSWGRLFGNSLRQSNGTNVSDRISEPTSADVTVHAIGAKMRPS